MSNGSLRRKQWMTANPVRTGIWGLGPTVTQAAFAEMAGVSYGALRRYVRGDLRPGLEAFAKMAKALGVPPGALRAEWEKWEKREPKK